MAGVTVIALLRALYAACDDILIDERTHAVVYQHQRIPRDILIVPECSQAVPYRLLTGLAAGYDVLYLLNAEPLQQLIEIAYPALKAYHCYRVYLRVALEKFDGMYNDGLSVQLKELLGLGLGIHSRAGSSGKYQR